MFVEVCRCVGYFTIIVAYLELSFQLYFYKLIIDSIQRLHSQSTSRVFVTAEHILYMRKEREAQAFKLLVQDPQAIVGRARVHAHTCLALSHSAHSLFQSHSSTEICPGVLRNSGISASFSNSQPRFKFNLSCHILNFKASTDVGQP